MVKSACGIEAVYMCFNGTGIWGGETLKTSDQLFSYYHSLGRVFPRFIVIVKLQKIEVVL